MAQRPPNVPNTPNVPMLPPPSDQRASATIPNASRRTRAQHRRNPPSMTTPMTPASGSESTPWSSEWRRDALRRMDATDRRVDDNERSLQGAAIILERLSNHFDEHDRRIAALEQAPGQQAQQQQTRVGLNLQAVYVGVAICALVVAILSPHLALTFH